MADNPGLTELREKYIELTKLFFHEISKGKPAEDLHQLQDEIEKTLLQIDKIENQQPPAAG